MCVRVRTKCDATADPVSPKTTLGHISARKGGGAFLLGPLGTVLGRLGVVLIGSWVALTMNNAALPQNDNDNVVTMYLQ